MATKQIYQMLVKLLSWIVLRARSDTTKDFGDRLLHELSATSAAFVWRRLPEAS